MPGLTIDATLEPRGPAGALVLDEDQVAALGEGKQAFGVRVTVNGHTFEGRVARMGGESLIGFNKAVRAACGVEIGERVEALVEPDAAPRTVEVPAALAAALDDAGLRAAFDAWPPSRRKEAARQVTDAKQDATRERRIAKLLGELDSSR